MKRMTIICQRNLRLDKKAYSDREINRDNDNIILSNVSLEFVTTVRAVHFSLLQNIPCHIHVPIVLKSRSLKLLESSGPVTGWLYLYILQNMQTGFSSGVLCRSNECRVFFYV
jgi:hypothetical protein